MKVSVSDIEKGKLRGWKSFHLNKFQESDEEYLFGQDQTGKFGVYLLLSDKPFKRFKGKSRIIYIGQGKLRDRLIALLDVLFTKHKNNTERNHVVKDYLKELMKKHQIRIYFKNLKSSKSSKKYEKELLQEYCENHIDSPPFNSTKQ